MSVHQFFRPSVAFKSFNCTEQILRLLDNYGMSVRNKDLPLTVKKRGAFLLITLMKRVIYETFHSYAKHQYVPV